MTGTTLEDALGMEWRSRNFTMPDPMDLVPVTSVNLGGGYDWDEFHAWYSPSRRVYYWASDSGCSCNSFGDGLDSIDDFENGRSRADVMAGANRYFDDQDTNPAQERVRVLHEINSFNEKEHTA